MGWKLIKMLISFCTTVSNRLWQLKETLAHNVIFTKVGEIEINIVAYNDTTIKGYLEENYLEHLKDGRIVLVEINDDYKPKDGSGFACGYVKQFSHATANGKILFNLDADNFIDEFLINELKTLKESQILVLDPRTIKPDGRAGRIGIHKSSYLKVGGYRDKGRSDDLDFCYRAILKGLRTVYHLCRIAPLPNDK